MILRCRYGGCCVRRPKSSGRRARRADGRLRRLQTCMLESTSPRPHAICRYVNHRQDSPCDSPWRLLLSSRPEAGQASDTVSHGLRSSLLSLSSSHLRMPHYVPPVIARLLKCTARGLSITCGESAKQMHPHPRTTGTKPSNNRRVFILTALRPF